MRSRRVPTWMPFLAAAVVAVTILGIASGIYRMLWTRAIERTKQTQAEALDRCGFYIEARVRGRINDIFLLKGVMEGAFIHGNFEEGILDLRPAGKRLLLSRPVYRRLVFLDDSGREKFVQRYQALEHPVIVEEGVENLSDRSPDAAYRDIRAASSTEVAVSMSSDTTGTEDCLMLGAQVVNATGHPVGVLILEADLRELVKSLEAVPVSANARPILYTLDGTEIDPPPTDAADQSKPLSPEIQERVLQREHGSAMSHGFLYNFRKIDPASATLAYPPLSMPIAHAERLRWILVSRLPLSAIGKEIASARIALCAITALALMLFVPGTWYAATALRQRNIARNSLFQSEHLLQIASRMTKVGAWRLSFPEEKMFWSREVFQIFEVSSQFVPSADALLGFMSPDDADRLREALAWGEKGEAFDLELRANSAKLRPLWVHMIGEVELDRTGKMVNLSGTIQDITSAKETVAQERRLTAAAHAAERAKASFLAVMSHEIRTPMNGIIGFADMLAARPLATEEKEYVRIIQESGQALLRILDDILDYSRLEAGHLQTTISDFDPRDIVQIVSTLLSPLARHKSVALSSAIEPDLPRLLNGDSGRIRQILLNLANNALKFTQKGGITIGVRTAVEKPDHRTWLEFYVQDSGIGIPAEKLDSIFEPFVQADGTISRRYGGTGLGLAISKSFAELLGGKIKVESAVGEGSLFRFFVPLELASQAPVPGQTADSILDRSFARQFPLKILVVEDDPINMKLINQLLRQWGYEPSGATNGKDAVEKAAHEQLDCILMDIHMPEMDGLQAIELIRQIHRTDNCADIFIAALSADVMPEDQALCLACGADFYLTKPIKKPLLAQALQQAFQQKKTSGDDTG